MSILFEPASIGSMRLKNRIIRSATFENMASPEGLPTDNTLRLYERLARGGVGLIITGMAYVNKAGQAYPFQHGAHSDAMVPEWRRIADVAHEHGAGLAMQLVHCGRQTKSRALGRRPVAPSAVPELFNFNRPRAMTDHEIRQTIADFGEAAARVKAAGFDAVQIHGAHGYLVSGFLSPLTNRRRDYWGGDPGRRFRFLAEVYRAVRKAVGPDFPVLCKLNADDFIWFGLRPGESFPAARGLAEMGLDALELSGGIYETLLNIVRGGAPLELFKHDRTLPQMMFLRLAVAVQKRRTPFIEAYFLPYAERLKPLLTIPLILVGGIRRPETAERILESGAADFISMSRPLVREPGLPNKWLSGRRDAAQCRSCNRCAGEEDRGNQLKCYARSSTLN